MPSPDVSRYVDLTLFDLSSQDIYLNALRYARVVLPEFEPVEGSIETVLLQSMALEVRDLIVSINRLPGGIVQALLGILGVPRIDGSASTGTVKLTAGVPRDVSVPMGLRLLYSTDTTEPITLATTEAVTLSLRQNLDLLTRDTSGVITITTSGYHGYTSADVDADILVTISSTVSAASGMTGTFQLIDVPSSTTIKVQSGTLSATSVSVSGTTSYVEASSADKEPYGFANVSTVLPGDYYVAAGTSLDLLSSFREVSSAQLFTDLDGGRTAESDDEYFQRASAALGRMTSALVTADQIAQYVAAEYPEFYRVKAIDNTNANRVGGQGGQVLVVGAPINATTTNDISTADLATAASGVARHSHAALTVSTDNALLAEISATVNVKTIDGITDAEAENAIATQLESYFSPNAWDWDQWVRVNEVMHAIRGTTINGVEIVDYVSSVSLAITDTNISTLSHALSATTYTGATISGGSITVTGSNALSAGDYIAIKPASDSAYTVTTVTTASGSSFSAPYAGASTSSTGSWAPLASVVSGDLHFYDPAPLTLSGDHVINIS